MKDRIISFILACTGGFFLGWGLNTAYRSAINHNKKSAPTPVCGVCVRLVESFTKTSIAELQSKRELAYDIGLISFRLGWIDRGHGYTFEQAQSNMTALLKDTLLITNETPPRPSDSEISRP